MKNKLNQIIQNPEFLKNIWLEITPLRLIILPLVMISVFYITWLLSGDWGDLAGMAGFLFGITGLLWGTRQTAESIVSEIRDKTWDFQRMSAITPWQMVWGKILGAASYQWIATFLSLAVMWIALAQKGVEQNPALTVAFFTVTALGVQSLSFLMALHFSSRSMGNGRNFSRSGSFFNMTAGFTSGIIIMSYGAESSAASEWYGISFPRTWFSLVSAAVFEAWILAASWRLMRLQLKRKGSLILWPLFIIFLNLYAAGFLVNESSPVSILITVLWTSVYVNAALVWFMLLTEEKNIIIFNRLLVFMQRFAEALKEKRLRLDFPRPDLTLPLWFVTLPFFLLSVKVFVIVYIISWFGGYTDTGPAVTVYALFFLIIRDTSLFVFFTVKSSSRRPELAALITLTILYGLLPLIFQAADQTGAASLFWPVASEYTITALITYPLQAAIGGGLAFYRWRTETEYTEPVY